MKKTFCSIVFTLTICLNVNAEDFVSIKIKEAKLRSKPQHWAPAIETLRYGDKLYKVKEDGAWTEVNKSKKTGFIQSSAISDKQILLTTASLGSTKADAGDVVLAGKGFSKSTEEEFAKNNSATNFAAVNKLEQIKISDAEMQKFVTSGSLALEAK